MGTIRKENFRLKSRIPEWSEQTVVKVKERQWESSDEGIIQTRKVKPLLESTHLEFL